MLAVQAWLSLSGAAWHSVSAASSDLTQCAVIGSKTANADANNANQEYLPIFSLSSNLAPFLSPLECKNINIYREGW